MSAATSTGHSDGLHNNYQGACYYHNMKLTVRVCCRPRHRGQLDLLFAIATHNAKCCIAESSDCCVCVHLIRTVVLSRA